MGYLYADTDRMDGVGRTLATVSQWIDAHPDNVARDREANLWCRIGKIGEEFGEATAALIGMTGQNPRKGVTHSVEDVCEELLDVAVTALAAYEHVIGNRGVVMDALADKIERIAQRAGIGSAS